MTPLAAADGPPRRPRRLRGDALLAQSTLLEEQPAPGALRWTAVAVLGLVTAFLVWAATAPLTELVRAEGDVEAIVPLQRVAHLEGGIVAELLVEDGQSVRAGQTLLRLDTRGLRAEREQLAVRARSLALDLERLEALLADRRPDFAAVDGATAAMIAAQLALFDGQRSAEESRRSVLDSQIAAARAEITSLQRLHADAGARLSMVEEEQSMRRDLARSGVTSRMQVIEVDLRQSTAESELRRIEAEAETAARTIAQTERRLAEMAAQTRAELLLQRAAVLRDAGELAEAIERLDDRMERSALLAPTSGVVVEAFAGTIGGVVAPGAEIARIAPEGAGLRIRARIAPADIALVAPGDAVQLSFPALDFARMPPLPGRVETLLPGTRPDAAGRLHHTAFIVLDDPDAGREAGLHLRPGMAAQAAIVAGEKTLLEYLFRPLRDLREKLFSQP